MDFESTLEGLFVSRGLSRERAAEFASRIHECCPWMTPDEEIAREIGIELLMDSLDGELLNVVDPESVIDWHNAAVRARHETYLGFDEDELYAEMCRLISNFGVQDPYGEGDYWVADESFSTKDLVVTQFKSRVVVPELRLRLDDFLAGNPAVGSLTVVDRFGDVLYVARRERPIQNR